MSFSGLPFMHRWSLRHLVSSLLLILVAPLSAAEASLPPQRIASLGLCTDQLLLMLVPRERIVSLTYMAADPGMSYMADQVGEIALNHTHAEEIIAQNPDLVIASQYASQDAVRMLRKLGYRVEQITLPQTIDDIHHLLRVAGNWFGTQASAEQLIHQMDASIAATQLRNAHKPQKTAFIWSANGITIGSNTLEDYLLQQAGYRNLAAELGIEGFQTMSLESLIMAQPQVLMIDNEVENRHSLAQRSLEHPVLQLLPNAQTQLFVPSRLRTCPGPMAAEAIAYLADHR